MKDLLCPGRRPAAPEILEAAKKAQEERDKLSIFHGRLPPTNLEEQLVTGRGRWKTVMQVIAEQEQAEAAEKAERESLELSICPEAIF